MGVFDAEFQLLVLCASMVPVLVAVGLLAHQQRRLAQQRILRLEEALRIYNGAAASVGRHITTLEREFSQFRARLDAAPRLSKMQRVTPSPAPAPVAPPPTAAAELKVPPAAAPEQPQEERVSNEPEARLLRLLQANGVSG